VVLVSATLADADPTVLVLATAIGLLAALVQFLGLVRWPFAVPHLARLAGDPASSPATRDAVEVVFQPLNRYLGVAVGEHLGYLFTGIWTALAGVALLQSEVLHPLFGIVGLVLVPLFVLWSLEFVGPFEPRGWKLAGTLVPLAYIGWSVRLLALGAQPADKLADGRLVRHPLDQRQQAEPAQVQRVRHLPDQRLVPQPVRCLRTMSGTKLPIGMVGRPWPRAVCAQTCSIGASRRGSTSSRSSAARSLGSS
jgi:hypothetical protein